MILVVLATRSLTVLPFEAIRSNYQKPIWYSMTQLSIRRLMAIIAITLISISSQAQSIKTAVSENVKSNKPYKILTSGKQVTVKSSKTIKSIMVWTASGHRIVEQKDVNATSFSFNINVSEKLFFVMIQLEGLKPYTEKIGVQ
jgi:hypothetical protein